MMLRVSDIILIIFLELYRLCHLLIVFEWTDNSWQKRTQKLEAVKMILFISVDIIENDDQVIDQMKDSLPGLF